MVDRVIELSLHRPRLLEGRIEPELDIGSGKTDLQPARGRSKFQSKNLDIPREATGSKLLRIDFEKFPRQTWVGRRHVASCGVSTPAPSARDGTDESGI